jgi:hypothetical protein
MMPASYKLLERRREQNLPTLVTFTDGAEYDLSTLDLMGENDDGEFEIFSLFVHQLAPDHVPRYRQKRADGFVYPARLIAKVLDASSGTVLYSRPHNPELG